MDNSPNFLADVFLELIATTVSGCIQTDICFLTDGITFSAFQECWNLLSQTEFLSRYVKNLKEAGIYF